jgi:hypothetical protein
MLLNRFDGDGILSGNRSVIFIMIAMISGCGTQTYRDRLDRTAEYYAHLEKLDKNLHEKRWSTGEVSLRVPRQFVLETGSEKGVPLVLKSLPGLKGQWKGVVAVQEQDEQRPCYLLVSTNQLSKEEKGQQILKPVHFQEQLANRLFKILNHPRPPANEVQTKQFPATAKYSDPKTVTVFESISDSDVLGLKGPYRVRLYTHVRGSVIVGILFVVPEDVHAKEHLTEEERIGWALETLRMTTPE